MEETDENVKKDVTREITLYSACASRFHLDPTVFDYYYKMKVKYFREQNLRGKMHLVLICQAVCEIRPGQTHNQANL